MRKEAWGALGLALALMGCATPASGPVQNIQASTVIVQCLPLKSYSLDQERAVAAEIAKLPAGDPVAAFIADYGQMRSADRACNGDAK